MIEGWRRYSEFVRSLVLVAALCALVAVGCGSSSGENATAPTTPTAAEPDQTETKPAREQAPAIEGTSLDGEPISLTDYRGQAVLINVWSSW